MKQNTEIFQLPQGSITITHYDNQLSVGLLELKPGQELSKHNRPVDEELIQMAGSCTMKLFEGDDLVKEVALKKGKKLIPKHYTLEVILY